ncbi:hypothetical protein [Sphaerimonospora thailandensis]|nr:hypothetical protein [Sphaerimonospora thailandensis]
MPYTSHGHPYGVVDTSQPKPTAIARCGGPGLCKTCRAEAGLDTPTDVEVWHCQGPHCTATAPAEADCWVDDLGGPFCGVHG